MGLLRKGEIISWEELWKTREIIKNRGIDQFIKAYLRNKNNTTSTKAYGEELELIAVIKTENKYKLYCGGENIIGKTDSTSVEFARYMVEISSIVPYTELRGMEDNIIKKIQDIEDLNIKDVEIIMMPCYPHMNFTNFYDSKFLTDDFTLSLNFPDNGITLHKRFQSLVQNIRNRRGRKQEGYIKVMDKDEYILIDSVGQGMGCCCLQVTIQGETIDEARYIYDMMGILGPLLLRMTRGTPAANGKLLQTETRWEMLEMSVDCRKDTERGFPCVYSNSYTEYPYSSPIPKSRCSSFDLFISTDSRNLDQYNDTNPPVHNDIYKKLIKKGNIDEKLARHVASLFIRDPFLSYEETNSSTFDDFENIQSSNWRSVRFKIPTESSEKDLQGWKVEVRPMEMQATPFENTAYIYFTYLIVQAILEYKLNFYIPLSKVDSNFIRANLFIKDSQSFTGKIMEDTQTFYYRSNIEDSGEPIIKEGTLKDIFIGTPENKGILYYVYKIIDEKYEEDRDTLQKYIRFIEDKLNNEYLCLSDWIRKFVMNHSDYKGDSEISDTILQDLIGKMVEIRKENTVDYLKN